jgi:hypothetical protein
MITRGERTELRSLIKQRFRVLRADVAQREAELHAELEERLNERLADDDKVWGDVSFLIGEAAREANRKANDAIRGLVGRDGWPNEGRIIWSASIDSVRKSVATPAPDRSVIRRQGQTRIGATIKAAQLQLDRQEVDLLTRLASGALESDEARAFLAEIPTVSALVPAERLLELERALKELP